VERKSLADLVTSMTSGKLRYALAELAALPRGAVVVEDRYSAIFKLDRIRPALVADGLAELQVGWPNVPIIYCDTRQLAQEWTYRFLAAARAWAKTEAAAPCHQLLTGLGRSGKDPVLGAAGLRCVLWKTSCPIAFAASTGICTLIRSCRFRSTAPRGSWRAG
jgi:hypothetical protein